MVLTSHRLEEVERLCDRILLLSEGKIVAQGAPEELSQRVDGQGLRALILKSGFMRRLPSLSSSRSPVGAQA